MPVKTQPFDGSHQQGDFLSEKANYFASFSRQIINQSAELLRGARTDCEKWKNGVVSNHVCRLGVDIDRSTLSDIERLMAGELKDIDPWREAQLRELAFWRWVAFEGYQSFPPEIYVLHQEHFMVSTFYRTGWTRSKFIGKSAFELGCGPLGMIEYLPAASRVAFDPLNEHYSKLFLNHRKADTRYIHDKAELGKLSEKFDLAICHNVIDHTDDPAWWFNKLFSQLKIGGDFLFQVNLSRRGVDQPADHVRMHPSPITSGQIMSWLGEKSNSFQHHESADKSSDGEFYFLAWGKKTHDRPVTYRNLAR